MRTFLCVIILAGMLPPLLAQEDPLPPGALFRIGDAGMQHEQPPFASIFSPDGKLIVSSGLDGVVRLTDIQTGKSKGHWKVMPGLSPVYLAYTPDGKQLIVGGRTGWIEFYDVAEKKKTQTLRLSAPGSRAAHVTQVALSPDGKTLLAVGYDDIVRVWDPTTGKEKQQHRLPYARALTTILTPDAKHFATENWTTGELVFSDPETGKEVRKTSIRDASSSAQSRMLVLSPDGKLLAVLRSDNTLGVWDLANGKSLWSRKETTTVDLTWSAFSPDGRLLAISSGNGVRVLGALTGKELRTLTASARGYLRPQFSADGRLLTAPGMGERSATVWDIDSGKSLFAPVSSEPLTELTFLAGSRLIGADVNNVRIFDLEKKVEVEKHPALKTSLVIAPDGRTAHWLTPEGKTLVTWKAGEQPQRKETAFELGSRGIRPVSPDGKFVVIPVQGGLSLCEMGTDKQTELKNLPPLFSTGLDSLSTMVFSPDGRLLVTGTNLGVVRAWDLEAKKDLWKQYTTSGELSPILKLIFSADGRNVYQPGPVARIFETTTGSIRVRPDGPEIGGPRPPVRIGEPTITARALSPDGRVILKGKSDGTLIVQLTASPRTPAATLLSGQRSISALAVSSDGKRFATAGANGTILVWEMNPDWLKDPAPAEKTPRAVEELWRGLASTDAEQAYRSIRNLASLPEETLPLLRKKLVLRGPADEKEISDLLDKLRSKDRAVWEKAQEDLIEIGEPAREAIQNVSRDVAPALRTRFAPLMWPINVGGGSVGQVRRLRAIEVLELIGTKDASEILQGLAKGPAKSPVTREAQAALDRLSRAGK